MIKVDRLKGTTEGLIKLRWLGLARIETILDELQKNKWLSRNLEKYPALVEKIEPARNAIEETKAEAAKTKSP